MASWARISVIDLVVLRVVMVVKYWTGGRMMAEVLMI